jgi:hypothetical protein
MLGNPSTLVVHRFPDLFGRAGENDWATPLNLSTMVEILHGSNTVPTDVVKK